MNDSPLINKSRAFALKMMSVCKEIKHPLINQVLRSSTSIGANIHEANYAHSRADFVAKMQIALKECYETEYWLILFRDSSIITDRQILEDCLELKRMLIASCRTAKS
jgi:four helix bundle protein